MLRSVQEIFGYKIKALDDYIGHVEDIYFDDHKWIVRYFVIDTSDWLPDRKVLVSPDKVEEPDWSNQALPVLMTVDDLKQAPGIYSDLPVHMQDKINLAQFPLFAAKWLPSGKPISLEGTKHPDEVIEGMPGKPKKPAGDPYLRSVDEVAHYEISTPEDHFGRVEDFIVDTELWPIRYLVVDTRKWLPGKRVLISPDWVEKVDWFDNHVHVDLSEEQIKNSPEYDPTKPINREYETVLYDYYGRPVYWK